MDDYIFGLETDDLPLQYDESYPYYYPYMEPDEFLPVAAESSREYARSMSPVFQQPDDQRLTSAISAYFTETPKEPSVFEDVRNEDEKLKDAIEAYFCMNEAPGTFKNLEAKDDPKLTDEEKAKKRQRERWAEQARKRYRNMTAEQREALYKKKRYKILNKAYSECKELGLLTNDRTQDMHILEQHIKQWNAKRAEMARAKYHSLTPEERKNYNKKRTICEKKRRQEEEELLKKPETQLTEEELEKVKKIKERNKKRATAALQRYRMQTPEQRKKACELARIRYKNMDPEKRKMLHVKRNEMKNKRNAALRQAASSEPRPGTSRQ